MNEKDTEACGRCAITTVVDATESGRDVLGEERIEIAEREMRRTSPHHVAASRLKSWFDSLGTRLIYGR
ncbi:hypothetical protein [Halalkalicoccus jeotgali]|uniref:Uncharacterized protein n=1 Tax=Halalkalicoccus jeotgali (strain DSM 18796 / CECT 7217 / JCM 14584 / KCTC 4019 / B3) TaxID=795797 RepID=D8J4B0_HALJB|nr:hypothetical protein [Halalkalicoccus jeotgali]ADJ13472.1 hypothetical protein HacjB3_00395 [Halalkalicoccus jeotgali B3]ELY33053.1 hypothetical protein C497_18937 [Halalkalicoccus jeotgali B3]